MSVVFDRKKNATKRGKGKIELYVYLSRTEKKYLTICEATPSNWKAVVETNKVQEFVKKAEDIINAMEILGEDMNIETFNQHFNNLKGESESNDQNFYNGYDQERSFTDFMEDCINEEDLAAGTRKNKRCMLKKLREFGGMEKFKDLTPANVIKWDRFLHDGTRTDNTIFGIHKKIHEYTKRLKDSEMIEKDPYAYVNFPKGRCKERKPLNEDELLKIRQLVLSPKLDRVRDLFVFSAYTGLSFIDVMDFNFDKDTIYQNGMYYIEGNRIKTGSCFYTPILNPAMEVLKKYDNKLPHISNQKANDYLHLIEEKAELKKPLTFHVARHSFATLALSHDVPIEDVAKMLGHHDIKTTQIYAKILHTSIERHSVELGHQII